MHGYEMERLIDERGMRNWTEVGFSSIYFVLRRLEKQGLVVSRLEQAPGRGPARRIYAPTDPGRAAYKDGLVRALSVPQRPYPLFLQGLAALPSMPPKQAALCLDRYIEGLDARLEEFAGREGPEIPFHVQAMFSHSRCLIEAEREWVRALKRTLEAAHAKKRRRNARHSRIQP